LAAERSDEVGNKVIKIRAFDGSLDDARSIIEIDRATFADCPYSAEQIVALEADPGQYAWVAEDGSQVVGYVSAFATHSLAAGRWEVDELAVLPQAQGQGIGTALVARALEAGARQACLREARALVAVENKSSQRVFVKNGFQAVDTVHLLAFRVNGRVPRPPRPGAPTVRPVLAGERETLARLLEEQADGAARMDRQLRRAEAQYLVAVGAAKLLGGAELIHVRTLQYEGLWIEALAVTKGGAVENRAAPALLSAAIEKVKRDEELDLVGYLVAPREQALYAAAVAEGMTLIDRYKSYVHAW
jgi:ribosomal protein S18 acetylase RimI-like enzyme